MNNIDPYRNAWNLMKQMVDEYSKEKKYLTNREIKYIIRTCERGIDVYAAFNDFKKDWGPLSFEALSY